MALKGKGKRMIQAACDKGEPIIGHGSLAARYMQGAPFGGWGRLPQEEQDILNQDIARDGQCFVVWSYSTPIGWLSRMGWRIPEVKYSVTTTNHQNVLAVAAANRGYYADAKW